MANTKHDIQAENRTYQVNFGRVFTKRAHPCSRHPDLETETTRIPEILQSVSPAPRVIASLISYRSFRLACFYTLHKWDYTAQTLLLLASLIQY